MVAAAASVTAPPLSRDRRSGVNSVISVSSLLLRPVIGGIFQMMMCVIAWPSHRSGERAGSTRCNHLPVARSMRARPACKAAFLSHMVAANFRCHPAQAARAAPSIDSLIPGFYGSRSFITLEY
jgi:hypothetical protein